MGFEHLGESHAHVGACRNTWVGGGRPPLIDEPESSRGDIVIAFHPERRAYGPPLQNLRVSFEKSKIKSIKIGKSGKISFS